ncbi:P-loop containing nucleoside triphosphate hydrolases superfamily protein isoform 1 [Hibiscus syriacus]|uniref:P-loop containing nucleoside triphosphate hydrolases superfamily protein isoform 1 n=1 Tax=Hibiscus syriacus TaxID=106335 RepID=A0A6A3D110_HIBSY|nr:P-loop containing nucleoside triphosphate hydrolases superfamily protein isoform 1 [Hibiscus syriacus]
MVATGHTSTWYRDYWMSQHQDEDGFYNNAEDDGFDGTDIADLLPDTFDLISDEDLSGIDLQLEELVQEMESTSPPLPSNAGTGLEKDAETLMKNLSLLQSSPRVQRSEAGRNPYSRERGGGGGGGGVQCRGLKWPARSDGGWWTSKHAPRAANRVAHEFARWAAHCTLPIWFVSDVP